MITSSMHNKILRVLAMVLLVAHAPLINRPASFYDYIQPSETKRESRPHQNCRIQRGKSGTWEQDWDYANRTNYPVYGSYTTWHWASNNFQPSSISPFRLATSWRWQDDRCPVQEISRESFCQVSWELGLTRYLIVGDSLSIEFLFSFLSLLGLPPKHRRFTFRGILKPFVIPCQAMDENNVTQSFKTTLWMYRRSPEKDFVALRDQVRKNQTDEAHVSFVKDNPNKTVIVANLGAWMADMSAYKGAFDSLLEWLDWFQPEDKVMMFFRPSLPGHLGCQPAGNKTDYDQHGYSNLTETPYEDYNTYNETTERLLTSSNETAPETYNWMEMEAYNDYSRQRLHNRSSHIHWLNVFPSTILRRDGHVGYGNDCLHYALPGPTDWWVHFFHSMLWDIRGEEVQISPASSS